jgi:hypothetical protein
MTRDEAVSIAVEAKKKWGGGSSEYWLVIALEALGVLKLEDSRTTDERLAASLTKIFSFDTNATEMTFFRDHVAKNNRKIVDTSVSRPPRGGSE